MHGYGNNLNVMEGELKMLSKINSISLMGIEGFVVKVEVDIQGGLPGVCMVGLPDTVVKESKERVRSAIKNSGLSFPPTKIIVNFAPADIKKEGPHLDLAIAVAMLTSMGKINNMDIGSYAFIGELSLNGEIRGVKGILPMILEAEKRGFKSIFIPYENKNEAGFKRKITVYSVSSLLELVDFLNGDIFVERIESSDKDILVDLNYDVDFSEVKGQYFAKRAIEIAACGGHNVLMLGPPGGGKTMISQRIPTILPNLTYDEAIEVTKIYSISGLLKDNGNIIYKTPFRSPHHTASTISIIGGGSNPVPGEVSLAHNGVLFLDELPEFRRDALESLRQPIENGDVCISRVKGKYTYPARFMMIASMNPCPCGYYGYQLKECRCTSIQIRNYLSRVSGPLLDRIDIHITVEPVKFDEISSKKDEESSKDIRERVIIARKLQKDRFKDEGISFNSQMKTRHIKKYCSLDNGGMKLLEGAFKALSLSTRAYSKILKISRTIADMEGSNCILEKHIAEAIQYRILDRKYWG